MADMILIFAGSISATLAHQHLLRAFGPLREPHSRSATVLRNKLDTCALKSRNQLFGRLSPAANCIGSFVRLQPADGRL
jgi:hypothetical protein